MVYLEADEENDSYELYSQAQIPFGYRISHLFDRPGVLLGLQVSHCFPVSSDIRNWKRSASTKLTS